MSLAPVHFPLGAAELTPGIWGYVRVKKQKKLAAKKLQINSLHRFDIRDEHDSVTAKDSRCSTERKSAQASSSAEVRGLMAEQGRAVAARRRCNLLHTRDIGLPSRCGAARRDLEVSGSTRILQTAPLHGYKAILSAMLGQYRACPTTPCYHHGSLYRSCYPRE
ncbi:hypothetical protein J6590_024124 [Homalodisca vitripennis]|nr:hypothetical protein J6590_024124 [Homalodisca vitripennis]